MKNYFVIILFINLIASCSFQSTQLDYLKSLIKENENEMAPKKNWQIIWGDFKTDLYAINISENVVFANEDINIFFRNDTIYKITGLNSMQKNIDIKRYVNNIEYSVNYAKVATDECSEAEKSTEGSNKILIQSCVSELNQDLYSNSLVRNSNGELTKLVFRIIPGYPSIILSMK